MASRNDRKGLRQHWHQLLLGWESSKLSQAEYCRQHQLNLKSFYRWKNILTKRPISIKTNTENFPDFCKVSVASEASSELDTSKSTSPYRKLRYKEIIVDYLERNELISVLERLLA